MLSCFGVSRKTRPAAADKEGHSSPREGDVARKVGAKCTAGCGSLWLHIDFKANVTQVPAEVRVL